MIVDEKKWTCELIYYSLHLYYYARHGQLGPVMASKIKINYYLNVLYIYDVLDRELNNKADEIKKAAAL
nr:MAG TPA: hypothetical protein [Caudoviricetes sp.]